MYKFATLDTRSVPAAQAANDATFAGGPVYGIEVTVPALAARCVGNLDPQHTGGDTSKAAIEAALEAPICPLAITLATPKPDLDSVGTMAVFCIKQKTAFLASEGFAERIRMVAEADRFARGPYPGPTPLPSLANPWPPHGSAESSRPLAAIAAAVADFKVPLDQRVALMEEWLLTGEEPANYRSLVEKERADLVRAIERGEIHRELREPLVGGTHRKVAVVHTTHRAATLLGYCVAPVVVALNPAFRFQGGPEHAKFTICQYTTGHADLKAVTAELQKLDPVCQVQTGTSPDGKPIYPTWGGSPTIIGSPQGVGSELALDEVILVVVRHLKS